MAALPGGLRLVHEVAPAFGFVGVVEVRRVHRRAAAAAGELLHEVHAHVVAGGNQEDAVIVIRHGVGEGAELVQFSEPRGDRHAAVPAVIFVGRGTEADGAGVHGVAEQPHHRFEFIVTRRAPGAVVAHDDGANGGVRGQRRHVRVDALAAQQVEVLTKALEPPAHPGFQGVEGHAFDLGQVGENGVASVRRRGCNAEAAVADHHGGDAQRGRRRGGGVPGQLRVVMGMQVNHAGRQHHAVGVYGRRRWLRHLPDFRHAATLNRQIALLQGIAKPVGDARVSYYQVVHSRSPFRAATPMGSPSRSRSHIRSGVA